MDQKVEIILKEAEVLKISPKEGETLIFKFKGDEFNDQKMINEFGRQLRKLFPTNRVIVMALPNGHDVELTAVENQGTVEESSCSKPTSYCNDCGCGKKERILKEQEEKKD